MVFSNFSEWLVVLLNLEPRFLLQYRVGADRSKKVKWGQATGPQLSQSISVNLSFVCGPESMLITESLGLQKAEWSHTSMVLPLGSVR